MALGIYIKHTVSFVGKIDHIDFFVYLYTVEPIFLMENYINIGYIRFKLCLVKTVIECSNQLDCESTPEAIAFYY